MPWVPIITVAVVLLCIVGVFFIKIDELSGVGREHPQGSFRWKHGKLVRSRVLYVEDGVPRNKLVVRVLVPSLAIAVVCAVLIMVGPLTAYGNVLTVISILASLALASLFRGQRDTARSFAYSLVCLVIACAVLILLTQAYVQVSTAEVNAFTCVFAAVGASVGAALVPERVIFAREFADGERNIIRLSQRSTAAALIVAVEDKQWDVPAHLREAAKILHEKGRLSASDTASER